MSRAKEISFGLPIKVLFSHLCIFWPYGFFFSFVSKNINCTKYTYRNYTEYVQRAVGTIERTKFRDQTKRNGMSAEWRIRCVHQVKKTTHGEKIFLFNVVPFESNGQQIWRNRWWLCFFFSVVVATCSQYFFLSRFPQSVPCLCKNMCERSFLYLSFHLFSLLPCIVLLRFLSNLSASIFCHDHFSTSRCTLTVSIRHSNIGMRSKH